MRKEPEIGNGDEMAQAIRELAMASCGGDKTERQLAVTRLLCIGRSDFVGIKGIFLTLLYFAATLAAFYFMLMGCGLALGILVFIVMSLIYVWYIYGFKRGTSPKKRKSSVQPQQQPKPMAFNGETLIELAALVSDNDPDGK